MSRKTWKDFIKNGSEAWKDFIEKQGGINNIPAWQKVGFELASVSPKHRGMKIGAKFEDESYEGEYYFSMLTEEFLKLNDEDKLKVIESILFELKTTRGQNIIKMYRDPEFYIQIITLTMRHNYLFDQQKHDKVRLVINDLIQNLLNDKEKRTGKKQIEKQFSNLKDTPQERWVHHIKISNGKIETWDKVAFEIAGFYSTDEIIPIKKEDDEYIKIVRNEFIKLSNEDKVKVVKFVTEALQESRSQGLGEYESYHNVSPAYLFAMSEKWK